MNLKKVFNNAVAQDEKNGVRRYDVATITLKSESGESEAMKNGVSKTFYYSGYAKGCGKGAEKDSTLKLEVKDLETIKLEVKHANYRTGNYNEYVCDEINTVYFSVPERFFSTYGALQKIKASWYEYKTNPIFITSDDGAYEALMNFRNIDIGEHTDIDTLAWRVLWEEDIWSSSVNNPACLECHNSYNANVEELDGSKQTQYYRVAEDCKYVTRMDWLFLRSDEYTVTREEMEEYMRQYTATFSAQEKILGKYAKDLFANSIDNDRLSLLENANATSGYVEQTIDAGEKQNLLVAKEQSKWDKFWHGVQYENRGIEPIVVLTKNDVAGLNADSFASKYYIGDTDKTRVFNDIKAMLDKGERAVLFRFAVTDYYLCQARFDKAGDRKGLFDGVIDLSEEDGYVAQETMFLDFTVIELTFRKDSVDSVIPCVANPIDIINGVDTFPEDPSIPKDSFRLLDLIETFLAIVVLIFVVWCIVKFIGWVINGLSKGGG